MRFKKSFVGFIMPALFIFFVSYCGEKKPKVLKGTITFLKGKVLVNDKRVTVGTQIVKNDRIYVKKKASAIVQFGSGALVTLKSNTKLEVARLLYEKDGLPLVNLKQTKGSTFSKIQPNKAKYTIATPTSVAGVRGTAFSMTVSGKKGKMKSEIRLLHGKVEVKTRVKRKKKKGQVKATVKEEVYILTAGQKVVTTKKKGLSKVKKLDKDEKASLKQLDKIAFVPKKTLELAPDKIVVELKENAKNASVVPDKLVENLAKEELIVVKADEVEEVKAVDHKTKEKVQKVKVAKKLTLADLKAKYGKLTKIVTRSGQSFTGGDWKQVGDYHIIKTINGKKKVKTSDVFKVLPLD